MIYQKKPVHLVGYYLVLALSLLLVLVFSTWRLPWGGLFFWPSWPLLWLCFWMTYAEDRPMHSAWVWVAGLGMDGLTASLLGLHVFLYLLVYYGIMARYWNIYLFSALSQPFLILLLIMFSMFLEKIILNGLPNFSSVLMVLVQSTLTFCLWFLLKSWFDNRLARSQYLSSFELK